MFVECLLTIAYSRNKKSNDFFIGLQSLLKTVLIEVTEPIKNCINRGYEAYQNRINRGADDSSFVIGAKDEMD